MANRGQSASQLHSIGIGAQVPISPSLRASQHLCCIARVVRAVRQSAEDAKRFGAFCGEEGSHRTILRSPRPDHAPSRVKDAACRTVLRSSPAAILLRPPTCMDARIAWTLTMSVRHTLRGAPCAPWTQLSRSLYFKTPRPPQKCLFALVPTGP